MPEARHYSGNDVTIYIMCGCVSEKINIFSYLFLSRLLSISESTAEACLRKEIHILKELTVHCIVFIIRHFFGIFNTYGTGSFPPGFQGWHRQILFIPSQPPFKSPYLTIACLVYSEQVG